MKNSYIQQLWPQLNSNNFFYILGLTISILMQLKSETYWILPDTIDKTLKYGSCLLLGMHLIMTLPKYGKKIPLVLIFIAIILFVGLNTKQTYMMFTTATLIFGAKGLNFNNIVKWYFWTGLFFCMTTIIGNQIGLIKGHDVYIDVLSSRLSFALSGKRLSFGYIWSTDFATHCFFILLAYWYIRKAGLTVKEMLLFVLGAIVILYYTDAKLGAALTCGGGNVSSINNIALSLGLVTNINYLCASGNVKGNSGLSHDPVNNEFGGSGGGGGGVTDNSFELGSGGNGSSGYLRIRWDMAEND